MPCGSRTAPGRNPGRSFRRLGCRTNTRRRIHVPKFKLGQRVRRTLPGYAAVKADVSDVFEIVRLVPEDQTGEPHYRIKSGLPSAPYARARSSRSDRDPPRAGRREARTRQLSTTTRLPISTRP